MKNRLAKRTCALMERTHERRDMFEWIQPVEEPEDKELEELRLSIFEDLKGANSWDESFAQSIAMLEKVYALKAKRRKPRAKPDTLVMAVAHVTGIAMIMIHEHARPWTSRAIHEGAFTKLFR